MWIDTFTAFQAANADLDNESLIQMELAILGWAEKHGHDLADARRRARSRKKLFDAADEIVNQGWEPDQVPLFLQGHLASRMESDRLKRLARLLAQRHSVEDEEEPVVTMAPVTVYQD